MFRVTSSFLVRLWIFLSLTGYPLAQDAPLASVPGAEYLFGLSAAPKGKSVLLLSSAAAPEGEITSGTMTLLRFDSRQAVVKRLAVPDSQNDLSLAAWTSFGDTAYFLTAEGLYVVDINNVGPKLLVRGALSGLALSRDDAKLAFWDLAPGEKLHYELNVFDLKTARTLRKWSLENQYSADQYGFEIAFTADGSAILARTYDTEGRTPLKQFRIDSGTVRTISGDCSGLASSNRDVYFVSRNEGRRSLRRIFANGSAATEVIPDFHYGKLMASGSRRWIVAQDSRTRRLAVFDSETQKLTDLGSKCEAATVLADGQVILTFRGFLFATAAGCGMAPKASK